MQNKDKTLKLVPDVESGLQKCRQCKNVIGKIIANGNMMIGFYNAEKEEFAGAAILISSTFFRCPRGGCYTKHYFEPIRDPRLQT